jgi:formamidopyrimidine-DNA glycosylase
MPELPEVQTVVSGLKKTILGKNIKSIFSDSSRVFSGRDFSKELVGEKIVDVKRRGKYIIVDLSNNKAILIHLGMTGNLFYAKSQDAYAHLDD